MADHPVTVVIDWDDTLVGYKRFGQPGEWLPGAEDALRELLAAGYAVTVCSCRVAWGDGVATIRAKLREGGFRPVLVLSEAAVRPVAAEVERVSSPERGELGIWIGAGKPLGMIYVDDRGAQFDNDWQATLEEVRERAGKP